MFKTVCKLSLEGIVSKKLAAPYRSGPSKPGSSQKSESSGGYTGYRRDFLRARSVSLLGVKRTWVAAPHESAFDPKRTSTAVYEIIFYYAAPASGVGIAVPPGMKRFPTELIPQ